MKGGTAGSRKPGLCWCSLNVNSCRDPWARAEAREHTGQEIMDCVTEFSDKKAHKPQLPGKSSGNYLTYLVTTEASHYRDIWYDRMGPEMTLNSHQKTSKARCLDPAVQDW